VESRNARYEAYLERYDSDISNHYDAPFPYQLPYASQETAGRTVESSRDWERSLRDSISKCWDAGIHIKHDNIQMMYIPNKGKGTCWLYAPGRSSNGVSFAQYRLMTQCDKAFLPQIFSFNLVIMIEVLAKDQLCGIYYHNNKSAHTVTPFFGGKRNSLSCAINSFDYIDLPFSFSLTSRNFAIGSTKRSFRT